MKKKVIAGILALALVATAFAVVSAQTNSGDSASGGYGGGPGGPCCMSQLTDDERQEMHQKMLEFRQQLAEQYGIDLTDDEREEIHQQMQEYRQELFEQYGISCPNSPLGTDEGGNSPRGPMGLRMPGFGGGPGFEEIPPTPPDLE